MWPIPVVAQPVFMAATYRPMAAMRLQPADAIKKPEDRSAGLGPVPPKTNRSPVLCFPHEQLLRAQTTERLHQSRGVFLREASSQIPQRKKNTMTYDGSAAPASGYETGDGDVSRARTIYTGDGQCWLDDPERQLGRHFAYAASA